MNPFSLITFTALTLHVGMASGSDYPALDGLRTSESFTSSSWFNCGLQPSTSPSTGNLQLKVVSVRGAGSCTSSEVYNLTCEKFTNRCTRGSTPFYTCTNGDFYYGERYARGFYYGDMIAPCEKIPDQVGALISASFINDAGDLIDYVLPGKTYKLYLRVKNETSEILSGYQTSLNFMGLTGMTASSAQPDFGDIAERGYGIQTDIAVTVPKNTCSSTFTMNFTISKGERKRQFSRIFSVGKPVHAAKIFRIPGTPAALKSDGKTTFSIPVVGTDWPYNAAVYQATYRSRITHESLGEISEVMLKPPHSSAINLFRGDGKRNGSQSNNAELSSALGGKNGWGDWNLTFQEKDWRQDGELQSFELELTPAVFNCNL